MRIVPTRTRLRSVSGELKSLSSNSDNDWIKLRFRRNLYLTAELIVELRYFDLFFGFTCRF